MSLNFRPSAGKQTEIAGPSSKGEVLEDGKTYLGYATAQAAALSPQGFVAAAGHDLGKQILGLCRTDHTAMHQFRVEQGSEVAHLQKGSCKRIDCQLIILAVINFAADGALFRCHSQAADCLLELSLHQSKILINTCAKAPGHLILPSKDDTPPALGIATGTREKGHAQIFGRPEQD